MVMPAGARVHDNDGARSNVSEPAVMRRQRDQRPTQRVEKRQIVYDAHDIPDDAGSEVQPKSTLFDDPNVHSALADALAIPPDLKKDEVSVVNRKLNENDEARNPEVGRNAKFREGPDDPGA